MAMGHITKARRQLWTAWPSGLTQEPLGRGSASQTQMPRVEDKSGFAQLPPSNLRGFREGTLEPEPGEKTVLEKHMSTQATIPTL